MDLDQLLDDSAPQVTPRSPQLQLHLHEMVAAAEAETVRRTPRRLAVAAVAVVGVLGVGTAAGAAGVLPGWPSFLTSSGQSCSIEVAAEPLQSGDGEPVAGTFSPAEQSETLEAARDYLAAFDYDAVDRDEAIAWWRAEERAARAGQPDPDERQPRLTGDDLEVTAVSHWVVDRLRTHLAGQGLDIRAVGIVVTNGCEL